jgi:hypothetical protein
MGHASYYNCCWFLNFSCWNLNLNQNCDLVRGSPGHPHLIGIATSEWQISCGGAAPHAGHYTRSLSLVAGFLDLNYKLPDISKHKSKDHCRLQNSNTVTWIMATYFWIFVCLSWSSSKAKPKLWAHANEKNQIVHTMNSCIWNHNVNLVYHVLILLVSMYVNS